MIRDIPTVGNSKGDALDTQVMVGHARGAGVVRIAWLHDPHKLLQATRSLLMQAPVRRVI